MDLRLLEIFCAVYEERSFSRAGKRLHLTQPTVSTHIKRLERILGLPVFDRLPREVRPTRAGVLLYDYGRRIVETKRDLLDAMNRFLGRLEGELLVGASTIPGEYLLPPLVARFREVHPGVQVRLLIRDTRAIVEEVEEGRVEVGFVGARVLDDDLEFQEFATDRLILVAPTTSDLGDGTITLQGLKSRPLLLREPGSGTRFMFERKLEELGHRLGDFQVVAELGSTTAVKEAVKAGLGWAILSHLAVQTEVDAGILQPMKILELDDLVRRFFTVLNRKRSRSPLVEAFLEELALPAS